ncbi:unnamed protein product [Durusdinium trenchii]|uniref:Ribose-phosphate pyrophosphokinase N-terminal domain-containing protein n=1 Tax=Durusdinium trenchii TaxID=1381693 RepID=A0ABP0MCU0_9DINO
MQAIQRAHRIGQTRPVKAVRFISADTIEEKIIKLQEKKQLVFDASIDGSSTSLGKLTEQEKATGALMGLIGFGHDRFERKCLGPLTRLWKSSELSQSPVEVADEAPKSREDRLCRLGHGPARVLGEGVGHPPVVFCTPGNRDLCEKIVAHLSWSIGKAAVMGAVAGNDDRILVSDAHNGYARFRTFANGEISVKLEQSVSNYDVFVVCARDDFECEINFMLMQLLIMLDALKSESPHRITVVLPCVEYSRQDRKFEAGEAIAPKLLLHLMATAGADRFVTIDLHNQAEVGFSPAQAALDELTCEKYLAAFIRDMIPNFKPEETLVCATDAGGAKRTRKMADELQAPHKCRTDKLLAASCSRVLCAVLA